MESFTSRSTRIARVSEISPTTSQSLVSRLREQLLGSANAPFELKVVRSCSFDTTALAHAAHVSRLAELGRREVREITPEVLSRPDALYAEVRQALETRALIWLLGPLTHSEAEEAAGSLAHLLVRVGEEPSTGHGAYALRVEHVVEALIHEAEFRRALEGMNATRTPRHLTRLIRSARVRVYRRSLVSQILADPRFWVYTVVFVYSMLRALPVIWVPQFHGSVAMLWAIDVFTAIPYTWGVLAMFTASRPLERYSGALTAFVTFIAPYIYFWMYGSNYPKTVVIVVAVMIVSSFVIEGVRFIQNNRLVRRYRDVAVPAGAPGSSAQR